MNSTFRSVRCWTSSNRQALLLFRRSFSLAEPSRDETFYSQYLQAQQRLQDFDKAEEATKSAKMFDAWEKQQDSSKDRSVRQRDTGIAVVRTLAKETKTKSTANERVALQQNARDLLKQAAHVDNHPLALLQLGNDMLQERKVVEAIEYYREAGELGSAEAWFNLGHCLWEGASSIEANVGEAMSSFRKAISLGDLDSMYFVGVHLLGEEEGPVPQFTEGLKLLQTASEGNHGKAMHYLALFYKNGFPPLSIEPCTDFEFIERVDAAVACDTTGEACFLRGSCRWSGDAYQTDLHGALHDFLRASDMGQSDAAVSAGAILHKGVPGVIEPDKRQAFHLYQHAGELGNIEGWRNVVACYAAGEGAPQSTSMAKYIAELMLRHDQSQED